MSWEVVGIVSKRQCGGAVRRVLLLTLANYASNDGRNIFASIPSLARDSEIDPRTVQRNMKELIEAGLLEQVGQRKCRYGYTNEYRLILSAVKSLPEIIRTEDMAESHPRQRATPDNTPPVIEAEFTPDTVPPPAECPPGTVSPNPRQAATQSCQGTLVADAVDAARAMTREEFASASKRILEACGPGLIDPNKSFVPIQKLSARLPVWLTKFDLELDIIAVLAAKTARPRSGSPIYDPTIFENDIAAHHAARTRPLPEITHEGHIQNRAEFAGADGSANARPVYGPGAGASRSGYQPRSGNLAASKARVQRMREEAAGVPDQSEDWRDDWVA